jgi:hypothetical protein
VLVANFLDIATDNRLTLTALTGDGDPLEAATVTYELKTRGGVLVAGGSGTLAHDAGGTYTGVIDAAVTALLAEGTVYHVWLVAVEGGYKKTWRMDATARYAAG